MALSMLRYQIGIFILIGFNGIAVTQENPLSEQNDMFGTDSQTSFRCAESLFTGKLQSIPLLIGYFNDETPYFGFLGANTRLSESRSSGEVTQEDLDAIKEFRRQHKEGEKISDNNNAYRKNGLKRDAALYLIVAILKGDFYHARTMRPQYESAKEYQSALGEIAIEYIRCQTRKGIFTWESVKRILDKKKVLFK